MNNWLKINPHTRTTSGKNSGAKRNSSFGVEIKELIKKAPKTPGVYVFHEKQKILYIGKASDLRSRLKSYIKSGDFKNDRLQENATNLKLIPLRSEIETRIEEA